MSEVRTHLKKEKKNYGQDRAQFDKSMHNKSNLFQMKTEKK